MSHFYISVRAVPFEKLWGDGKQPKNFSRGRGVRVKNKNVIRGEGV